MKIAHLVLKGIPLGGGIEKYVDEVGSRHAQKGHEITVYTMRHYEATDGMYKGMRIITVPTISRRSMEKLGAFFVSVFFQAFQKDTDIVHIHSFNSFVSGLLPRLMGRKVLLQGHGIEWKRSKWNLFGRLFLRLSEWTSVRISHAVTVVSKVQQEYIQNKYGIKCSYIPTGVSDPDIKPPELIKEYGLDGNDYILFAARLVREKGAHYLIEAYNRLDTNMKLVVAGDAKHEDEYKDYLKGLAGNNENIIFTGFVTGQRLNELFSNCYFFVLPSEIEGLPIALLEAMSYGNCALASDIPENIEALGGNGFTFSNMDRDDLARKLDNLLKNQKEVVSVKEKARAHVLENYLWDDIADKFESLYQSLIDEQV